LGKTNLLDFISFFENIFLLYRSRFREVADIPRSLQLIFEVNIREIIFNETDRGDIRTLRLQCIVMFFLFILRENRVNNE
jgi:hypothetical protein